MGQVENGHLYTRYKSTSQKYKWELGIIRDCSRPYWKKSLFGLTWPTTFWMANRILFSRLHRICVHACVQVTCIACNGTWVASLIASARKYDCKCSRVWLRVLAIILICTDDSREYSQSNSRVLAIILISSGARAGWQLEESLYQETRCHDYTTTSISLPPSLFTNKIGENTEIKKRPSTC